MPIWHQADMLAATDPSRILNIRAMMKNYCHKRFAARLPFRSVPSQVANPAMPVHHHMRLVAIAGSTGVIALFSIFGITSASAASFEQIREKCLEALRPQVQACMQRGKGSGDREARLTACRQAVKPAVQACYRREAQRAGKPAPAPPPVQGEGPGDGSLAPNRLLAPPRSIADITAILDAEQPDPDKIAKLKAEAEAEPPDGKSPRDLAQFYYDRGNARALLGRTREGLSDGLKALEVGTAGIDGRQRTRLRQFVAEQYRTLGQKKKALEVSQLALQEAQREGRRGDTIYWLRRIASFHISMGDIAQAENYARRVVALVQEARASPGARWRAGYAERGSAWEGDADSARAIIFRARGQLREAEAAYVRAEAFRRAWANSPTKNAPPTEQILLNADYIVLAMARLKARQGRLAEAEADARRALLGVLRSWGKYSPHALKFIGGLAGILIEQGRYQEAEQLIRAALDIQRRLGMREETPGRVQTLLQLAQTLILQRRTAEAADVYDSIEKATEHWDPQRRQVFLLNNARIRVLYASGQIDAGIAVALDIIKRQSEHADANPYLAALTRGLLAIGLARAQRDAEAKPEFQAAISALTSTWLEDVDDDDEEGGGLVAARRQNLQMIVEAYIALLARTSGGSVAAAAESLALADMLRGRSVQKALSAANARVIAQDAALAELVRSEQDSSKQLGAQLGLLNNALALPPGERDASLIVSLKTRIRDLRRDIDKARVDIRRRFPNYADVMDPKPVTVEQITAVLGHAEAMLSFYFGQDSSFVWVVPKEGDIAFASLSLTAAELETQVSTLRLGLDPDVALISEVPPFDLELAYDLYARLLKPVEASWKPAKSLVVVTNGALGHLPLPLLPTASSRIDDHPLLFAGYREVPWLARTHAVTMLPTVQALHALRTLPQGKRKREKLIAFGAPEFSRGGSSPTVRVADAGAVMRSPRLERRSSPLLKGVDRPDLTLLPALPDTALELKSIADALDADPARALFLGKDASKRNVKSSDLTRFEVVAFATHGLLPGDLSGLAQPALALSAPEGADAEDDGLLTMEEILALRMDADWVVLSACNTGSGAGAGAEAASGLGRAFFYAGARALLVTNWPVHSASARELVSDLFRRQAKNTGLARAEALRQSMLALIDGDGFKPDGADESSFSYAHPLFWAPYSIIGDGAQR